MFVFLTHISENHNYQCIKKCIRTYYRCEPAIQQKKRHKNNERNNNKLKLNSLCEYIRKENRLSRDPRSIVLLLYSTIKNNFV